MNLLKIYLKKVQGEKDGMTYDILQYFRESFEEAAENFIGQKNNKDTIRGMNSQFIAIVDDMSYIPDGVNVTLSIPIRGP